MSKKYVVECYCVRKFVLFFLLKSVYGFRFEAPIAYKKKSEITFFVPRIFDLYVNFINSLATDW